MVTYEELEKLWQEKPRPWCHQPGLTFAEEGVLLGCGCVVCKSEGRTARGMTLQIDGQEDRILALLSLACGKLIHPDVIKNFRNAGRALAKGEKALAAIHLCHAGLPKFKSDDERKVKLLFQASQLLDDGMEPGDLLKGLDMLPQAVSGEQWSEYLKANFNSDEPRDDHGCWTDGGGGDAAGDKPNDGHVQSADNRPFNTRNDASLTDASPDQMTLSGRTYKVGDTFSGNASYYGNRDPSQGQTDNFAGKPTASGAIMDPSAMTAAVFPGSVPLGSTVRVTLGSDSSKSVEVTVNDHGLYNAVDGQRVPYPGNRVIDLSPAAYKQLKGSLKSGIAGVTVTTVKLPTSHRH